MACFNSDQIDKGPPVYQQPDAELQESKQQLRKSEVANNQSWVRSIKDLCPNFRGDVQMTSALRGREGVSRILTKEREVA